jgi:Tol biopolymer transport system component
VEHHRGFHPLLTILLSLLLVILLAPPATAQYFGRNKVQYDDFDFEVLETENFRIHYYERESLQAVEDFGRMAERWYERFARTFEHAFEGKKPILVYANKADFQQTNAVPSFLSQGVGGVTESIKNRVIMPTAGTYAETDHVLGHELIHSFQYDIAATRRGGGGVAFNRIPGWLIEGMPEYLSLGREHAHTAMWLRDAILHDRFPTIEDLTRGQEFFPYRYGHALWAFIAGVYGDQAVPRVFLAAGQAGVETAIQRELGISPDTLSMVWERTVRDHYEPLMEERTHPEDVGREVLSPAKGSGEMNVSPSLSPDGSMVAYFSQKDLFTIDLFLADAQTGEVLGKLASSARNPHFDNLFFISSTGSWSPDGERFAFVTFANGDNEIAIADVDTRRVDRVLGLEDIGAVYAVDWSPDGATLVFSGSRSGVTDLFLVDVDTGDVTQVTDDRYAELQPTWSPDGGRIAFATDRGGGTDFQRLQFAPLGLGIMDRVSGEVSVYRPFPDSKHINPQWAPDGESLYFVSDRFGFSDVYRMAPGSRDVFQVTNVATGVTGITEDAPALSVARGEGSLVFTVFQGGDYLGYALSPDEAGGQRVEALPTGEGERLAAFLPPPTVQRGEGFVEDYLANATLGLPAEGVFGRQDYDAGLQLDYLAQPQAGVAVNRFGAGLAGSVAAFFSDMLGNHQLGVAVQAQGRVQDIGGQVSYQNRENRTNYGAMAGRIPFRTGFARQGTTEVEGETVRFVDFITAWTILNRAAVMAEYPFSNTNRIEADVGVTHFGFDREVRRSFFTPGGTFLGTDEISPSEAGIGTPSGITTYNGMLAYVGDYSFFGFTAPVRGGRYRFEMEGNVGDLQYVSALADYRRYFFFNPVTLAFRGMHYARYGSDANDQRLSPLFLGYQTLVRGYSVYSFDGSECGSGSGQGASACPEFDRLVGTRLALGNVEIRVPLFGTEQFGLISQTFVPTDLSLFFDGGVAWTEAESPELTFATDTPDRVPVFSLGVSTRLNVLGRLVMEFYWAHAFQRDNSSQFGFQIAPGW